MLSAFLISNVLAKDLTGRRKKKRNSDYYFKVKHNEDFIARRNLTAQSYYIRQCKRIKSQSRLLIKYEENINLRQLKWPQKKFMH